MAMEPSIFCDRTQEPDDSQLADALGPTAGLWQELREHLESEYGPLLEEWKIYSEKSGWMKKVLRKKRNLFFFTPLDGRFRLGFVFGDRAVAAVEASELDDEIKQELRDARKYAEGRGLVLEVRTLEDIEPVKTLVAIKVKN
jgi:hypothetical protein